jgi:L-alanine-DL-glutamate epimerase-like enolase superfamily enzyme
VDSLAVKVTTGQGLEGWGEAFGITAVPVTQRAIDELIAPLRVGRDGTRSAPLMHDVRAKLHVFGQGPVALALSAVDIALRDIAGKAAGAPLHRLMGWAPPTWPAMRAGHLGRSLAGPRGCPAGARRRIPEHQAARKRASGGSRRSRRGQAVDFVQPSPANMGGVTKLVKVFPPAALRTMTVMPYTFYDGPVLLAGHR